MIDKFKLLLGQSERILITSHLGPDADSLCSSLLLASILKANYSNKQTCVAMEEDYSPLNFLDGYNEIKFAKLIKTIEEFKPDLLVILDGNNLSRCAREPGSIREYAKANNTAVVVIDHHFEIDVEPDSLYINQKSPAVTQDIYEICFNSLNLTKPDNYAQTAMIGLYSDTGGFTYDNPRHEDTFKMASELISDGASTELAASQLTQYSHDAIDVLEELLKNIQGTEDCTHSFISDEFYAEWQKNKRPADAIHEGFDIFLHNFIRNIEGRIWGFTVYPDPKAPERTYSVSLRSLQGRVDVSKIARKLGGGGHKAAAGAKIKTSSVDEAIKIIEEAIAEA